MILIEFALNKYVTLEQYLINLEAVYVKIPNTSGVYFVIFPYDSLDDKLIFPGTGGHFKGKDPNVTEEKLLLKWE